MNTNAKTILSLRGQSEQKNCSSCGASFGCGANSAERNCWCNLPHVALVAGADQDCLCPDCLGQAVAKLTARQEETVAASAPDNTANAPLPLVEGRDYYLEGAAMVFTARFLLRRGYCCESGCRHCPYSEFEQGISNASEF